MVRRLLQIAFGCWRELALLDLQTIFDVTVSVLALPFVGLFSVIILCINPASNRGPLFFTQARMGRNGQPFRIIKFRTMLPATAASRGPEDPVEIDRITAFGAFLRRTRIDESRNSSTFSGAR